MVKASEETEKVMLKLVVDKKEADEVQKQVSKDEAEASIQQAEATKLANKAEQAVSEANIALESTLLEV